MTAPDIAETVKRLVQTLRNASKPRYISKGFYTGPKAQSGINCEDGNAAADTLEAILAELERATGERDAAQRQYALHVQLWTDADKRAETAAVRILDLEEFQIDLANSSRTQRERAEAAEAAVGDWAARYKAINEEYALARRLLCERTAEVARLEADLIVAKTMRAVVEIQLTEGSRDGHEAFEEDMK